MKLNEFINQYDKEGMVVLLEGKRDVLEEDKEKLIQLGKLLSENTRYMKFRSGNADGADLYFSQGVVEKNQSRLQVITPYTSHRKKANIAGETVDLGSLNLSPEDKIILETIKAGKKIEKIVHRYFEGHKDRGAIKAPYLIRDAVKVLGTSEVSPAGFGIFYVDLKDPKSGGTGHTIRVCENNNVPAIDQTIWFTWLN